MNITQTAVKRPVATTMVFLIIIVLGVMGFRFLPVDLFIPGCPPQPYTILDGLLRLLGKRETDRC